MKQKLVLLPKAQRVLNDLGENIKLTAKKEVRYYSGSGAGWYKPGNALAN